MSPAWLPALKWSDSACTRRLMDASMASPNSMLSAVSPHNRMRGVGRSSMIDHPVTSSLNHRRPGVPFTGAALRVVHSMENSILGGKRASSRECAGGPGRSGTWRGFGEQRMKVRDADVSFHWQPPFKHGIITGNSRFSSSSEDLAGVGRSAESDRHHGECFGRTNHQRLVS